MSTLRTTTLTSCLFLCRTSTTCGQTISFRLFPVRERFVVIPFYWISAVFDERGRKLCHVEIWPWNPDYSRLGIIWHKNILSGEKHSSVSTEFLILKTKFEELVYDVIQEDNQWSYSSTNDLLSGWTRSSRIPQASGLLLFSFQWYFGRCR